MIIHFTAKHISSQHASFIARWVQLNPDDQIKVYSDEANLELIRTHYPQFLKAYNNFQHHIERVDFVRYAYLHHFGGAYSDIDVEPYRPIANLVSEVPTFPIEPIPNGFGNQFLIGNYFMMAPQGSDMMLEAMARAAQPFVYTGNKRIDVLKRTGCVMLTKLAQDYHCGLLPSDYFTPTKTSDQPYGRHHFASTWW